MVKCLRVVFTLGLNSVPVWFAQIIVHVCLDADPLLVLRNRAPSTGVLSGRCVQP